MKKEPRYELVYSTRWEKPEKPLVEQMAETMKDIDILHMKLRQATKELKQLKP